ncbi:LysR family transcriptional regulator substrate-binding protein [Streptomyces sp. NRRL S-1824]|uniref:LysR family transcriptional regulator substrate-binding protein n=1 Tax=Streptomyces sp. NRRL S-1824 TaxID=1463889 RepID=UPI000AEF0AD6|nr:LysR family transcriptional regulator substrate-binding protein [Streptomyces sp. NRRL S-1824]
MSIESLSSAEIRHGLAEFELDAAMTYLDDDTRGGGLRRLPLYEERYVLLTPVDGPLATAATARWAQAAALPLCLLGPRMRNRRIIDECFAADGATAAPAIESDSVARLYAHLPGGRWSSMISHACCTCSACRTACGWFRWRGPRMDHGSGWSPARTNRPRFSPRPCRRWPGRLTYDRRWTSSCAPTSADTDDDGRAGRCPTVIAVGYTGIARFALTRVFDPEDRELHLLET